MACYHPRAAYWARDGAVTPYADKACDRPGMPRASIPCGGCVGCRVGRARGWALRCQLELLEHDAGCWCTLTYDAEHVPWTLQVSHLQGFLKRLRARLSPRRVRFFASGEYGDEFSRPHYHAILFGVSGVEADIQAAWPCGIAREHELRAEGIAYVAGYCAEKLSPADEVDRVDWDTGECWQRPFLQMSRRPGIGAAARRFTRSWRSFALFNDAEVPVPRYLHEAWVAQASVEDVQRLRAERDVLMRAAWRRGDLSVERLDAGEAIARGKLLVQSQRRSLR